MNPILVSIYALSLLITTCVTPTDAYSAGTTSVVTSGYDDFDRLDGRGKSAKKVNVIEWEGNLEIHVYPKNSLKGLALKLDENTEKKKVMVIGYRFTPNKKDVLIRRAILGIPLSPGFRAFHDLSAADYDKIIISNNGLSISDTLAAFKLDPEPTQLYPDGVTAEMIAEMKQSQEGDENPENSDEMSGVMSPMGATSPRSPAASKRGPVNTGETVADHWAPTPRKMVEQPQPQFNEETGTIKPFGF